MGFSRNRSEFRSLRVESLEQRQLLAGDLIPLSPDGTRETWLSGLAAFVNSKLYESPVLTDKFDTVSSEAEFDATLKQLVGNYWQGVLGTSPSQLPSKSIDVAPVSEGFFGIGTVPSIRLSSSVLPLSAMPAQVQAGVAEADETATTSDGFVYAVVGGAVQVADVRDPSHIATSDVIELHGGNSRILVAGDALIVFQVLPTGLRSVNGQDAEFDQTHVRVYDLSQRMHPKLESTTIVDGNNLVARMSHGQLTLVQLHFALLPDPQLVTIDGGERYETLDSYYSSHRQAIMSALLPDYAVGLDGQATDNPKDAGAWDDLSFANDSLGPETTVLRFDLTGTKLTLLDTETIVGLNAQVVYQSQDNVYLVSPSTIADTQKQSFIYKIGAPASGQLAAQSVVKVFGAVNYASWLNESHGVLQVASQGSTMITVGGPMPTDGFEKLYVLPTFKARAIMTTIGQTADGWRVIGKLDNIADGQTLLAANFFGDHAILSVGDPETLVSPDPLHGVDLTTPDRPTEMSALSLPGFIRDLFQVDSTHWLSVGLDQNPQAVPAQRLQVNLFEVSKAGRPLLIDSWTSTEISWPISWNGPEFSFDAATGLLAITSQQQLSDGKNVSQPILKVELSSADPLRLLGTVALHESPLRGVTVGNTFVAVAEHTISTFDTHDLTEPLDIVDVPNYDSLEYQIWNVPMGGTQTVKLSDIWKEGTIQVTDFLTSGAITAILNEDQTITLATPTSPQFISQPLELKLQFESGRTRQMHVMLKSDFSYNQTVDQPTGPNYDAIGRGSLQARFTDDAGNVLSDLSAGDEVWVVVSATDGRNAPTGVFSAYVDVTFASQNVTVIGNVEHLGAYTNGADGVVRAGGIKNLGGFGGFTLPGVAAQDIARFKVRVDNDQPVTLTINPSTKYGSDFLLYGGSAVVDPANVTGFTLTTQLQTMRSMAGDTNRQQDVNSDGVITALDVLQIVNYINARGAAASEIAVASSSPSPLDITGDGVVSGLDVLQIVNTINDRNRSAASGEGSSLNAAAVDQLLAVDLDTIVRKK